MASEAWRRTLSEEGVANPAIEIADPTHKVCDQSESVPRPRPKGAAMRHAGRTEKRARGPHTRHVRSCDAFAGVVNRRGAVVDRGAAMAGPFRGVRGRGRGSDRCRRRGIEQADRAFDPPIGAVTIPIVGTHGPTAPGSATGSSRSGKTAKGNGRSHSPIHMAL